MMLIAVEIPAATNDGGYDDDIDDDGDGDGDDVWRLLQSFRTRSLPTWMARSCALCVLITITTVQDRQELHF